MGNESENMRRLRELTEQVHPFEHIAHVTNTTVRHDMTSGTCIGEGLFKNDKIAVQHAILTPNTELQPHAHEREKEILICYEGDFELITKEPASRMIKSVITTGGVLIIDAGVPHIAKSEGGAKLIGITIPAATGYPDGK